MRCCAYTPRRDGADGGALATEHGLSCAAPSGLRLRGRSALQTNPVPRLFTGLELPDGAAARDVAETLGDIRRPQAPVRFQGLSSFGGGMPRAIIAKIKAEPALIDLQAEQERRLRRIGLEPETRKFLPHVTLAKLRGVR